MDIAVGASTDDDGGSNRGAVWLLDINGTPTGRPIANANGPYIVHSMSWDGELVTIDGSGSYDPEGGPLTYEWDLDRSIDSDGDGILNNDVDATGQIVNKFFLLGEVEISLVVKDEEERTFRK